MTQTGQVEEEKFEYGNGLVAFQRPCTTRGCVGGLLLEPARFDPICKGSGLMVRWEENGQSSDGPSMPRYI